MSDLQWQVAGALVLLVESITAHLYMESALRQRFKEDLQWLWRKCDSWTVSIFVASGIWALGGIAMSEHAYPWAYGLFSSGGIVLCLQLVRWIRHEKPRGRRIAPGSIGLLAILLLVGGELGFTRYMEIRHAALATSGTLSATTILSTAEGIVPRIEIGTSGVIFTKSVPGGPPRPEFEIGKIFIGAGQYAFESLTPILSDCELKVENLNSETKVSMVLLDAGGNVVARLVGNDWDWGPRPVSFDRNYNKDSIEVQDNSGHIVLQLTVLQDRVRLQLVCFRKNGNRAYMIQVKPHPTGADDALMSFNNTAKDDLTRVIKPMFRYPSSLHFGELSQ